MSSLQSLLITTAKIDTLCSTEVLGSEADNVYLAFLELRIDASQSASCLEGSATSGAWLGCDVARSLQSITFTFSQSGGLASFFIAFDARNMPVTRAAANRNASTVRKAKATSAEVSKPSRERKAKVTKNTSPVKVNKGKSVKNATFHLSIGSKIPSTDSFGGELYLYDGTKTSLKQLVDKSRNGVIVYVYPKPWDDDGMGQVLQLSVLYFVLTLSLAYEVYGEFEHAQLDWEPAELDTIGVSPDSASSTAAFVKEKDTWLPLLSNPSGSLFKEMSITSPRGNMIQGAFIISKSGILLARTTGNHHKILDNLHKVIVTVIEERDKESDE